MGTRFNPVVTAWLRSGRAAGQQIYHTHLHIIPRKQDDKLAIAIGSHRVVSTTDLDKQQKEFKKLYG